MNIYARLDEGINYLPTNFFTNFYKASSLWQELLDIERSVPLMQTTTSLNTNLSTKLSSKPFSEFVSSTTVSSNHNTRDVSCEYSWTPKAQPVICPPKRIYKSCIASLRLFYENSNAQFKSVEQGRAVVYSLLRRLNMLVVLPTGAGKLLTYLLPAYMEKKSGLCSFH